MKKPIIAFGTVRFVTGDGITQTLPVERVDLEAARASWDRAELWSRLDDTAFLGRPLPEAWLVTQAGSREPLSAPGRWTLIELYRSYCLPCHAKLGQEHAWRAAGEDDGLRVIAVCVDCTSAQLGRIVRDRALRDSARWTNARLEVEPRWLTTDMAGWAKMNYLVDDAGVVRRARMTEPEIVREVWAVEAHVSRGDR